MNYQIKYDQFGYAKRTKMREIRIVRACIGLMILLIIACIIWCSGMDLNVTVTALETMAEQLKQGSGVQAAVAAFCVQILQGAQAG